MPLNVLYVEDEAAEVRRLTDAINEANKNKPEWSMLKLKNIPHPDELTAYLEKNPDVDIVLADVFFQTAGTSSPVPEEPHIQQIIDNVLHWNARSPYGFPTPVIAYTSYSKGSLDPCLKVKEGLFDIWDKASARPHYVAWRFQRLAAELRRQRPDTTMQKLIASMDATDCPPWHDRVLDLVKGYGQGQSEYEQIDNCRNAIQTILDQINAEHATALTNLWDDMTKSEPLLRAISPKLRGIARHSINVFWLGYWLINHPLLKKTLCVLWENMLVSRAGFSSLKSTQALEAFNVSWLITSLFHDVGKYHEHLSSIIKESKSFFEHFDYLGIGSSSWNTGNSDELWNTLKEVFRQISGKPDDPLVKSLEKRIIRCSKDGKPDHGAVSAAYLMGIGEVLKKDTIFSEYALEAARAVLLHNCLPAVYENNNKIRDEFHPIKWKTDPLACLLLFCDQIQTWDRHDTTRKNKNYPDRAELSALEVRDGTIDNKPTIKGCVDYVAPRIVDMYPSLRNDIAETLNKIILEKPKDSLLHVIEKNNWPFNVQLDCVLSGEKLAIVT